MYIEKEIEKINEVLGEDYFLTHYSIDNVEEAFEVFPIDYGWNIGQVFMKLEKLLNIPVLAGDVNVIFREHAEEIINSVIEEYFFDNELSILFHRDCSWTRVLGKYVKDCLDEEHQKELAKVEHSYVTEVLSHYLSYESAWRELIDNNYFDYSEMSESLIRYSDAELVAYLYQIEEYNLDDEKLFDVLRIKGFTEEQINNLKEVRYGFS